MSTSMAVRETSTTTERPVDLWVELDRLSRGDSAMMAERWDDVRRSRNARRRMKTIS